MTILKETRRILSLMLAICLLAGVLPSLAIADSTWKNRETPYSAKLKAGTALYADEEMEQETWLLKEDALVRVTETRPKTAKVEFTVKKQPKSAWVDGELLQPVDLATPTDLDAVIVSQDCHSEVRSARETVQWTVSSEERAAAPSNVEESNNEQVPTDNQPEETPIESEPEQGDPSTRPDGLGQDDNLTGSEPAKPEATNPQNVILSEVEESNNEQVSTDNQPEETPIEPEPEQGDPSTRPDGLGQDDNLTGSEPAKPEESNPGCHFEVRSARETVQWTVSSEERAAAPSNVEESPSKQVPTDLKPEETPIEAEPEQGDPSTRPDGLGQDDNLAGEEPAQPEESNLQNVILSEVEESNNEQVPTDNQPEETPIEAEPEQGDPSTRPDGLGQDDNLTGSEPAQPEATNPQNVILSEVEESNNEQIPTDNQPEEAPIEAEPEQGDPSTRPDSLGRDDNLTGSEPAEPEESNLQNVILSEVEESIDEQVPTDLKPEEAPIEAEPEQGDPSTRPDGLGQDDNLTGSEPAKPEETNPQNVILSEVEESLSEQVPTDLKPEETPIEAEPEQGDPSTRPDGLGQDDNLTGSEPAKPEETNPQNVILSEVEESNNEQIPTDNQPEESPIASEDPEPEIIEEPETLGSLQEELPETELLPSDVRAVPEEIDETAGTSPATVYALAGDGTMAASAYINPNLPASRAQSPYGTCWSFSTIGGLELDLIRDKAADTSIDLSEFFLIYYSGFTYANPKGGKDEIYSDLPALLDAGGDMGHAAYYLSVLIGTTTEADNPYTDAENRIPSNIRNIAAQITGSYALDTHDRDLIKSMILEHGGVSASINGDNIQNVLGDWTLYSTSTYTNHAILLVGWDDSYAVSNFQTPPPGPGAWYARNSWGDYKSYFWISYYDEGLLSRGGMAYDAQNTGMDNFVYTYAADPAQRSVSGGKDRAVAVQEYTVDAQEQITAVGIDVETPGVTISARVLVNGKEAGVTKSRKAAQKGSYRLPLVSPVLMTSRETVAVEVTYTGNGKDTIWFPYQTTGVDTRKNDKDQAITIRIHRADGNGFTLNDNHFDEDSTIRLYTKQKSSAGLVQSVTLNKTSLSLKTGEYANLKATIAPSDATNKTLTWTSSSPEIAYMDGNGRVVGGTKPGTTLITAMSSNGVYASCKVTVTWQEVAPRALYISSDLFDAGTKSYTIPATKGLRKGSKLILKAVSEPAYTSDFYTWTTSNLDVIGIGNVTRNECEVILNGSGKVRITLSAVNHPEISTYVDLNVNLYVPATWMQISAGTLKLLAGDTYQITAKLLPEDATDKTVTWTSSDPAIAKVDKTGLVTAVKGGNATITASAEGGSLTLTCDVTVIPRAESVTLDTKTKTLNEGDSFVLNATVKPSDAWDQRITWSSSDRNIATVNSSGRVTGVKDGTAVITVTTVDGGLTDTCTVTVKTTDPIKAFVYRMYRICLLREPDEGGFNGWVSALRKGTATGSQLAYGFLNSDEMIGRNLSDGDFVERNYEAIMGRASDAGGKQGWKDALAAGMSRKFVISGFVKSAEFANICKSYGIVKGDYTSDEARDVNTGVTGFVSRLYTKMLGRAYDPDGLNAWSAAILKAPTAATVLQVSLNGFMHSPEFVNKHLDDTELVKVLYRTFLDREADQGGLSAWVQALQQGNDRDTVAAGFANSPEFAAIMAKYGF